MTYLDHAATTPLRSVVRDAVVEAWEIGGNPASTHRAGQLANAMLEQGRERVAAALGAHPTEVVFTSGGTESINLAIKGFWWSRKRPRIVVPEAEHHATLDTVLWLEQQGAQLSWVPVDSLGRIDVEAFERALGPDVAVATALAANNEVGTLQPIEQLAALAKDAAVPLHLDAVGTFGHVPIDFRAIGAAAMSVTAHKLGGPVGVGALVIAREHAPQALIHGGGQQRALRSGTGDVVGAHAFGVAAEEAVAELSVESERLAGFRELVHAAVEPIEGVRVRGDRVDRLPGTVHFTVEGVDGESLQFLLDEAGFQVSTGSACTAGVAQESHVLRAMGVFDDTQERIGALRITLGHTTTRAEIDALLAVLPKSIAQARTA
ncbi:cysteine desulfurase family protein [Humidisolicoccus flavus]|uniref:cysteine desulfurase family protein n=1 Tax=Humidisolicoccus flavus TaxID=3111414 RepID=UPI003244DB32